MLRSRLACVPLALALVLITASAAAPAATAAGPHSTARFSTGAARWKIPRIARAMVPAPAWKPIIDVVTNFNTAVVRNKQEMAYRYLTDELHKKAQQASLDRMLGLHARPSRFSYRTAASDRHQAAVTVTYYLANGRVAAVDWLGLERTASGWRIGRMARLPQ